MTDWLTLVALAFQIFKYFNNEKERTARQKKSADIIMECRREKKDPIFALWRCLQEVDGFTEAFISEIMGVDYLGWEDNPE